MDGEESSTAPSSKPSLDDVLDDLAARFILNLPESEFESFERLFFTIEEAHWFYLDFYRDRDKTLPSLGLYEFASRLFRRVPFLHPYVNHLDRLFADFRAYKRAVPTAGVAILNETLDKVLLVCGWRRNSWGFPKGKLAKDEDHAAAAVREALEETGFDVSAYIRRDAYADAVMSEAACRIFAAPGVPERTAFCPQARKEISAVEWHSVAELARVYKRTAADTETKSEGRRVFGVRPYIRWLLRFIKAQREPKARVTGSVETSSSKVPRPQAEAAARTSTVTEPVLIAPSAPNSAHRVDVAVPTPAPMAWVPPDTSEDPLRTFRLDARRFMRHLADMLA